MGSDRRIYLGKRVPDIRGRGLNTLEELVAILQSILDDYRFGEISYDLARRRMTFLKLVLKRSKRFPRKDLNEAYKIIDEYLVKLEDMRRVRGDRYG